jgi:hypothetical protein
MSFFDDIGDAFSTVGNGIKDVATTTYDTGKSLLDAGSVATGDGVKLLVEGWQDVLSGDVKDGLSKTALGMAEAVGIVPSSGVKLYEDAIGEASLWALRESQKTPLHPLVCFSAYWDKVQQNFAKLKLQSNDGVKQQARDGIREMPWINPNC